MEVNQEKQFEKINIDSMEPLSNPRPSIYVTNQSTEGTCYAHASARVIARFIKIQLKYNYENKRIPEDRIDILYNTVTCNNIFSCLLLKVYTPFEIVSVLLFRFIYNLIVSNFLTNGANTFDSINYFFDSIPETKDIPKFVYTHIKPDNNIFSEEINIIIGMIHKIKIISNTIKIQNYVLDNNLLLRTIISLLDAGYYANIDLFPSKYHNDDNNGHAMVISGYEIIDGSVKLKIKNSWGRYHYFINNGIFNLENGEFTISIDTLLRFEGKISIIIIYTQLKKLPYQVTAFKNLVKKLPETFTLTPINSIKDDAVDDDFIFTVRCILFFIIIKSSVSLNTQNFDFLRNIQLEIIMNCDYHPYNLSICEVLEHLKKYIDNLWFRSPEPILVKIQYDSNNPTIEIFREFFKEYPVQMPLVVEELCNKLIEPNKGIKLSRTLNIRGLRSNERKKLNIRENRYRLKKWRIPFTKYGGKKKHTNRLKTKKNKK